MLIYPELALSYMLVWSDDHSNCLISKGAASAPLRAGCRIFYIYGSEGLLTAGAAEQRSETRLFEVPRLLD